MTRVNWWQVSICALLGVALGSLAGPSVFAQHDNKHDERALATDPRLAPGQIAPLLEDLGTHHHAVTTSSKAAQQFFDQGLKLTYGFNHQEALRAFKEAARVDPDCAMAYWGWALVLGPNLNLPMRPEVVQQAYESMQMAVERRDRVSQKERDMIDALATRYTSDPEADRAALDAAYAEAMAGLHETYPHDNDISTLYAAALMNLSPWNYWKADGSPKLNTPILLAALEQVIEADPFHEGALHYYIHAVEAVDPRRGELAADRLWGLAPGAGHLVHMPSHIWMQVGRYADSFEANTKAAKADEGYITQCKAQGIYPLIYYPHNVHFLAWAASLQGRGAATLAASRKVAEGVPHEMDDGPPLYQTFSAMPLAAMIRFGMWEEMMAEPQPPENQRFLTGMWYFGRGLAFADKGSLKDARKELQRVKDMKAEALAQNEMVGGARAASLLGIAQDILAGEIAVGEDDLHAAIGHLSMAMLTQDSLKYNEPPDWFLPVRHVLGPVLIEAHMAPQAEVIYREDLRRFPRNGYSLFGLWKSLEAQEKSEEAAEAKAQFDVAWSAADTELTSSWY